MNINLKQNAVKVSQSKLGYQKLAHCSKMALISNCVWKTATWFRAVQTMMLAVLDQFAQLLNLELGSAFNDEQLFGWPNFGPYFELDKLISL